MAAAPLAPPPPGEDEQLRNSFNYRLVGIKLSVACKMYGVAMPTEREGYRAHNALWDAEVAGRLYFAMRGILPTGQREESEDQSTEDE